MPAIFSAFKLDPLIKLIQQMDAQEITKDDIAPYDDELANFGPEHHEPLDLHRYFDTVYEIDIAYYYDYINTVTELKLSDNLSSQGQFRRNVPALCDVGAEDKLHISVLDARLSTNITRGIEQHEMLAAITSASSADVFHNEILEVLGDAFLKFSVSLYLIQQHVDWHEGFLSAIKGQIVGNRNLCYSAIRNKLPGMMNIHNFNPKDDWQPPMLKVADQIQVRNIFGAWK